MGIDSADMMQVLKRLGNRERRENPSRMSDIERAVDISFTGMRPDGDRFDGAFNMIARKNLSCSIGE